MRVVFKPPLIAHEVLYALKTDGIDGTHDTRRFIVGKLNIVDSAEVR